jgi:hypothetical protein
MSQSRYNLEVTTMDEIQRIGNVAGERMAEILSCDVSAILEDVRVSGKHTYRDLEEGQYLWQCVITPVRLTRYEVNTYIDGERAITRRRRSAKEVAQVFMHNVDAILEDVRESGKHTYNERAFGRLFSHVITISE